MARVFVSIGSNIDRTNNIRACIQSLRELYGDLILSTTWENEAVGFDGDAFFNLVAGFDTQDSIEDVVAAFRVIETRQGRERHSERFSARTLDIDLLLYDDLVTDEGNLQVPRDEITRYAFVLKPLAEVFPEGVHPVLNQTFSELWKAFDVTESEMKAVEAFPASH